LPADWEVALGGVPRQRQGWLSGCTVCEIAVTRIREGGSCVVKKQALTVGIAWYTREDWTRLKTLFEDAESLPANYTDWLTFAELSLQALAQQGISAYKVYITPDQFAAWCREKGLRKNALARMQYANTMIASMKAQPQETAH
jgi:hypothetical protein